MKPEKPKANLTMLRRLVDELDKFLNETYKLRDTIDEQELSKASETYKSFVVEISKATGLLVGISGEANALVGDLNKLALYSCPIDNSSMAAVDEKMDMDLSKYLFPQKSNKGGSRN